VLDLNVSEHAQVPRIDEFIAFLNGPSCHAGIDVIHDRVRAAKSQHDLARVVPEQLLAASHAKLRCQQRATDNSEGCKLDDRSIASLEVPLLKLLAISDELRCCFNGLSPLRPDLHLKLRLVLQKRVDLLKSTRFLSSESIAEVPVACLIEKE